MYQTYNTATRFDDITSPSLLDAFTLLEGPLGSINRSSQ
jgi:hypothetical protein